MDFQIDRVELERIQRENQHLKVVDPILLEDFIEFGQDAPPVGGGNGGGDKTNTTKAPLVKARKPVKVTSVLRYNVPWMETARRQPPYSQLPAERLHQEIVDFANYVSPVEEERYARSEAITRLTNVVNSVFPQATVQVFGSFDSQLYLPTSDLDLVVIDDSIDHNTANVNKSPLHRLAKALRKAAVPLPETLNLITKARVPIIKYVDALTDFEVDVCFNVPSGVEAAKFMQKEMRSQPAVRPLTLVLKHFLGMRSLNEVFHGGLGSYSIMCLVISFLQNHPLVQSGLIRAHENLGVLLIELFELYGRNFNAEEVGITVKQGGGYFLKEDRGWVNEAKPHLLAMEDPQNSDNDISKGSFAYGAVRQCFEHAYNVLRCAIREFEVFQRNTHTRSSKNHVPSILGSIITLDEKLLRHRYFIQQTANL